MGQLKQNSQNRNKREFSEYRRRQLNPDIDKRNHKHDSSIKLRIDYGTPKNDSSETSESVFKIPGTPLKHVSGNLINKQIVPLPTVDANVIIPPPLTTITTNKSIDVETHNEFCDEDYKEKEIKSESDSSLNGTSVPPLSPTSYKEEFYKYLGIDTNPSHDRSIKSENISNAKRRSLRVKVQQIAMNNIAKYNKEIENGKKKIDDPPSKQTDIINNTIPHVVAQSTLKKTSSSSNKIRKHMNNYEHNKKSSVCGSQTSSMASSKRIEPTDDKIISIGSSSVSSINSAKSNKSLITAKITTFKTEKHEHFDKDEECTIVVQEQPAVITDYDQRLKETPSPGSSERELTKIVHQIRRNSVKSNGDSSPLPLILTNKRRCSYNETIYSNVFLGVCNVEHLRPATFPDTVKRLKNSTDVLIKCSGLNSENVKDVIATTVDSSPMSSNNDQLSSLSRKSPSISNEVISTEKHQSIDPTITSYPVRQFNPIKELARSRVENYHLSLKFDEHNDIIMCDDKMLDESPVTPTTLAAVSAHSFDSVTSAPSILKLTYKTTETSSAVTASCLDRKQYKSIYLAGSPAKLIDNYRSSIAIVSTNSYNSFQNTPSRSSVLERRNYTKISPHSNQQNTVTFPVKYAAKILMTIKNDTIYDEKERLSLDAGQPTIQQNVVQQLRNKICIKSTNTLKPANTKPVKKVICSKRPNSPQNKRLKEKTPSAKIKIKKSLSVTMDEQQKAISQLNSLGIDSNKTEANEQTTPVLSKLQNIFKSRTFKSLRCGIRSKVSNFKRRHGKTKIKYSIPNNRLIKRKFVNRKKSLPMIDVTAPLIVLASTPLSQQQTQHKKQINFNSTTVPSEMVIDSTTPPKCIPSTSDDSSLVIATTLAKKCFNEFISPKTLPHLFGATTASAVTAVLEVANTNNEFEKKSADSPVSSTTSRISTDSAIGTSDRTINSTAATAPLPPPVKQVSGKIIVQRNINDILNSSNPLKQENGIVVAALYLNNTIVIVQELEISFWKYPSKIYSIFGVSQEWECLGIATREIGGKFFFLFLILDFLSKMKK